MEDELTQSVLGYQEGRIPFETVRDLVLVEAFAHLRRYRRKGEDEVSEFLLLFHDKIEGLLGRFRCQGLPFRHYLLRTLRWQWNTFRAGSAAERRRAWLAVDTGLGEVLAEPGASFGPAHAVISSDVLSPSALRRLVLMALKASPYLEDLHLEEICRQTGVDLAWIQACQYRLAAVTGQRRLRREVLVEKRGTAYYRRLEAEDEVRREDDPCRREGPERRAGLYRSRLHSLSHQQRVVSAAPTHRELSSFLGIPKGSIDSGLYHLKRELASVYSSSHEDDHPGGNEQCPQEARTRGDLLRLDTPDARRRGPRRLGS